MNNSDNRKDSDNRANQLNPNNPAYDKSRQGNEASNDEFADDHEFNHD